MIIHDHNEDRLMVYRWNEDLNRWEYWSSSLEWWIPSLHKECTKDIAPPACDIEAKYENTWAEPFYSE